MRATENFIKKLDIRFDVSALKKEWWNLYDQDLISDKIKMNQIGLTHTENCDVDNRWHQSVGSLFWDENHHLREADFVYVNEDLEKLSPYLWKVCHDMKSKFSIGRIRVMIMKPNTTYAMHRDFERRWHLPIIAPRNSFLYFRTNESHVLTDDVLESSHGVGFHIPANGYLYETDNSLWHTAVNTSTEETNEYDRVHLLFDEVIA